VLESTEVKVPVSRCLESSMFDEFSVAPLNDHVPRSTTPAIVSRSVQCETIDSFHTPRLDAEAPEFIRSHTDIPVFTTSTAVVLAQPTVSSMSDEYVLELCYVNPFAHATAPTPHLAQVHTSEVVDPQDRPPDSDSNAIEQRSFVDSTESCSDTVGDIKLPEHVNVLFYQTMEPLPGPSQVFEEPTGETRDTQDMDSQLLDSDLLASQRPKRTRCRPAALEPYILT